MTTVCVKCWRVSAQEQGRRVQASAGRGQQKRRRLSEALSVDTIFNVFSLARRKLWKCCSSLSWRIVHGRTWRISWGTCSWSV